MWRIGLVGVLVLVAGTQVLGLPAVATMLLLGGFALIGGWIGIDWPLIRSPIFG
jgi:hypothetical protein